MFVGYLYLAMISLGGLWQTGCGTIPEFVPEIEISPTETNEATDSTYLIVFPCLDQMDVQEVLSGKLT